MLPPISSYKDNLEDEKQSIVAVDDDMDLMSVLEEFFDHLGYKHRMAYNGLEALELIEKKPPTIIITDLLMPEMDGMDLVHEIKARWPDIDILVMTAYTKDFKYTDVVNAGASDFIQKPFSLDELEAKLNRIIRERTLKMALNRLAVRDCLTGLFNRRVFEEKLLEEAERSVRMKYNLYMIMLDLDKFKPVNDTMGHQEGDKILVTLAEVIKKSTRQNVDTAFRYGGDEFAVLLPSTKKMHVKDIAARLQNNFMLENTCDTSLSIGISLFMNTNRSIRKDIYAFIKAADDALYEAKKMGGNRIIMDEASEKQSYLLEGEISDSKNRDIFLHS
jgi:diguanylate cyclase (GGDEF)-like protein